MYQDVQGSPRMGLPPLVQSRVPYRSIFAIERLLRALHRRYESWREERAAVAELQGLGSHLLQDVGIERREIPKIVARQAAANRR